ncbi:MAG: hypothetical protein AB2L14_06500 [Candidatus Xenobiia bacterium LiM19]
MIMRIFAVLIAALSLLISVTRNIEAHSASRFPDYSAPIPFFDEYCTLWLELHVLERKQINERHEVATIRLLLKEKNPNLGYDQPGATIAEYFAVAVFDTIKKDPYLTIDLYPSVYFCDHKLTVKEAGKEKIVIRQERSIYGLHICDDAYFIDIKAGKLIKKVSYNDLKTYAMLEVEDELFLLGFESRERNILTRLPIRSGTYRPQDFAISDTIDELPIPHIFKAVSDDRRLILTSDNKEYVLSEGRWRAHSTADRRRFPDYPPETAVQSTLHYYDPFSGIEDFIISSSKKEACIFQRRSGDKKRFSLAMPSYRLFSMLRPKRARDGYSEAVSCIREAAGPVLERDNKIWFGLKFYDGEGFTGVGGFGIFDTVTGSITMQYPREMVDWSASAMLLEDEHLWIGLIRYPEGMSYGGGLLRYDTKSGEIRKYSIGETINFIHKVGDAIFIGTGNGISILRNDRMAEFEYGYDINRRRAVFLRK